MKLEKPTPKNQHRNNNRRETIDPQNALNARSDIFFCVKYAALVSSLARSLKGLSYVISTLQPAAAAAAIRQLVQPIAAGLQRDGAVAGDAKLAQQELDRLTVVVSHANPVMEVRVTIFLKSVTYFPTIMPRSVAFVFADMQLQAWCGLWCVMLFMPIFVSKYIPNCVAEGGLCEALVGS